MRDALKTVLYVSSPGLLLAGNSNKLFYYNQNLKTQITTVSSHNCWVKYKYLKSRTVLQSEKLRGKGSPGPGEQEVC